MRWNRHEEDELDQDIREHLEMEIEENLARGMSPEEARYAALRKFGSIAKVKEDTRGVWTWVWFETLRADAKHAFRRMRRTPGTSVLAVLSLAIAFAPSLTMFAIMDRLFLTTIPARAPEEIRDISFRDMRPETLRHHQGVSYAEAQDFAHMLPSFSGFAWQQGRGAIGMLNGRAETLMVELVNEDFFRVLGLPLSLGPGFSKTRPGLVISYALWSREFGRRPDVIGRTLMLNGRGLPIDGVAGPELYSSESPVGTDAWIPAETSAALLYGDSMTDRTLHWGRLWARLRPGVPEVRATAEVRAAARELARQWPETNRGLDSYIYAPIAERSRSGRNMTAIAIVFFGILLAVACANVAGVLLAHAEERRQETAIRLALGASRTRLMREWILESLFLSLTAAGLGIAAAYGLIRNLPDSMPSFPISFHFDFTLGTRALLYAAGLVAFSVLSFGIVPAWRASRPDLIASLRRDTAVRIARFRVPVRSLLIIGQVAAAEVLLFGAGWVLDATHMLARRDPGFDPHHPAAVAMLVPATEDGRPRPFDANAMCERLERIGGVRLASYGSSVPLVVLEGTPHWPAQLPGGATREVAGSYAGPGFFTTLGIRMLGGRDLQRTDAHGVLVNAKLARLVATDDRALGRTIRIDGEPAEVVGVFADAGWMSLHDDIQPRAVRLCSARGGGELWFAIETSGNPEAAVPVLRKELAAAQPGTMILTATTLAQHYEDSLYLERMGTRMFYALGCLALLLTATGLHGITAALYARRSREFAIRLALGASPRQIVSLVLRGGLGLTLTGIVLGLGVACPLALLIASNVEGFPTWSAMAIGLSALIVLLAAVAAAAQPAGRVLKLQPAETLRRE